MTLLIALQLASLLLVGITAALATRMTMALFARRDGPMLQALRYVFASLAVLTAATFLHGVLRFALLDRPDTLCLDVYRAVLVVPNALVAMALAWITKITSRKNEERHASGDRKEDNL